MQDKNIMLSITQGKIDNIKKYRSIRIQNIEFIKQRIHWQSQPGYDPVQPDTQATERQYSLYDLDREYKLLNLADNWLKNCGVACDNEPEQLNPAKYKGVSRQLDEWQKREFEKSMKHEKPEDNNQTEGYPANKSWEGVHHKTNGPGRQKEKS